MDKKAIIEIKKFIKKLKKEFTIKKVIFFGSRTGEEYLNKSDIDLIIVSKDFEKINFIKRTSIMYNYWDSDYDVDFLCYTPKEFDKLSKMITIVREAVKKGINII